MSRPLQRTLAILLLAVTAAMPATALAAPAPAPNPTTTPIAPPSAPGPDPKASVKPVLTEAKLTKADAIAAVKAVFTIPAGMNEPNASLSQSQSGAVWRLEWTTPAKNPDRIAISAGVDAVTGAIYNYSRSSSQQGDAAELKYSRDDAYKVAAQWLDKLAGKFKDSLRYIDDPMGYGFYGSTAYRFHWDRMEQGYPIAGHGLDLTIDSRTGELTSYSFSWLTELTYSLPDKLLDKAGAEAAYRDLPLQLMYKRFQKPGTDQGEWKLVYKPYGYAFPTLSQDGKWIDGGGKPIDFDRYMNGKVFPSLDKPWTKPAHPITREDALVLAQSITGRDDQPSSIDCQEYGEEKKLQACYFSFHRQGEDSSPTVQIDLEAGLVLNYSDWGRRSDPPATAVVPPTYTEEQARQIALDFLRKFRPDLAGNVLLTQPDARRMQNEQIQSYGIGLLYMMNATVMEGRSAQMEIDAMTGAIRYFWADRRPESTDKEPFPSVSGLIKQTQSMDGFLAHKGLELSWVTVYPEHPVPNGKGTPVKPGFEPKPQTMLVWAPRSVMPVDTIDAKTGALYDYSGRDIVEAAKRPVDIEGHFAQREIELLWARGVFELKDGKFNPNQTATAAELARWLVLSRGLQPYMSYDYSRNFAAMPSAGKALEASDSAPYFGAALQAGILLPEDFGNDYDPNAPVSREVFALWVARALGYGDIAKMENRIDTPYTDKAAVGAKYANAVAILWGLKISRGDGTTFYPQGQLTRGEAAKILFAVAAKGHPVYPYYK